MDKLYYKTWDVDIFNFVLLNIPSVMGKKVKLNGGIYEEWGVIVGADERGIIIDCMPFYGFSQRRRITSRNYARACFIR